MKKSLVLSWQSFPMILPVRKQETRPFQRKKKKRPNSEINGPGIREMLCRQAENGQRNERKDNNKVTVIDKPLCYRKKISKFLPLKYFVIVIQFLI